MPWVGYRVPEDPTSEELVWFPDESHFVLGGEPGSPGEGSTAGYSPSRIPQEVTPMARSEAKTVEQYLAELPPERSG